MPEELSRAEKMARADALRSEISALRLQEEHNAAAASEKTHDEALDRELERLEAEAAAARERAKNSGSVDDALAAMTAAAVIETQESTTLVTDKQAQELTPDLSLADEKPVTTKSSDKKAGGIK
jgi:hypothetical protein